MRQEPSNKKPLLGSASKIEVGLTVSNIKLTVYSVLSERSSVKALLTYTIQESTSTPKYKLLRLLILPVSLVTEHVTGS